MNPLTPQQRVFLLKINLSAGGEPVLVNMYEREARAILLQYQQGKLPEVIGDPVCAGPWVVRTSDIVSIQATPVDGQAGPQRPSAWPYGGSGLN